MAVKSCCNVSYLNVKQEQLPDPNIIMDMTQLQTRIALFTSKQHHKYPQSQVAPVVLVLRDTDLQKEDSYQQI